MYKSTAITFFVSIIIGFRNREILRIKNVMDSLEKQTCSGFELIFVDYGSDETISEQTKGLLTNYPFVKYIYSDTRGWFWNRAHALNTGIKLASGDIIIVSDIDLVFPSDFINSVNKLSFKNRFYTFKCYYLQENMDVVKIVDEDLKNTRINYVGLCAVLKEDVLTIAGFDEYYMSWGGEDDDLYVRLENNGCERQQMEVNEFPVLHQWHRNHAPSHPTPWYLEMINYLYLGYEKEKQHSNEFGTLIDSSDRSILNKAQQPGLLKCFELYGNSSLQFNLFIIGFSEMKKGEFGQFEFPVKPAPQLPRGRKQKVIDKLNIALKKWNVPYSVEKNIKAAPGINTRERWKEFIMYFIGKNRTLLNDYYLVDSQERLVLFFQKK